MEHHPTRKKHVLLIDDEKNLTQMLCMLLETRGYFVEIAYSAHEAFKKISPRIDLIILDVVLPDSDGFRVCQRIKQDATSRHIPVIMLSAHALQEDKVQGLYLGADDFLCKPCECEELLARMEVVMRRAQHVRKNSDDDNHVSELRKIIDEALLTPYFQPVYLIDELQLYGVEMLSRPQSTSALAQPEFLFQKALDCGMYNDLEMLGWSLALHELAKIPRQEKIFLNCNPYFIESSQFLRVEALFRRNHIAPGRVILEIVERSQVKNFALFYEQLHRYRDAGFKFAIDDMGGGYASLEAIVEIKPEVVKIDRHIITDLSNDTFRQSIIKFIAALCKDHAILSVAEGIETKEDLNIVKSLGIDAVQGFYLCRPSITIDWEKFKLPSNLRT